MWMRLLGSMLVASVVVLTMMVTGLRIWGLFDGEEVRYGLSRVELLSPAERLDLAELLGENTRPTLPEMPRAIEIPSLELEPRARKGFVQVEFLVGPDGRASNVEIVGATPGADYENQAREIIESRAYVPEYRDGQAVPSRRSEIVEFTLSPN